MESTALIISFRLEVMIFSVNMVISLGGGSGNKKATSPLEQDDGLCGCSIELKKALL